MNKMSPSGSLPVFSASSVLDRIEGGDPVIFEGVAIEGDLDISRLDLPLCHSDLAEGKTAKRVVSDIKIRNCQILGQANLSDAIFEGQVDFSGCDFSQEARFKGSVFQKPARFEAAVFYRYATFRDAVFLEEVRFTGAVFSEIVNFGRSVFQQSIFASAKFSPLCTNFKGASFRGETDMTGVAFPGTANFRSAEFMGSVGFWQASFGAEASFENAAFLAYASFSSAEFSGMADFRQSSFEDSSFESANFLGGAVFISVGMAGRADFTHSRFRDASFDTSIFGQELDFTGSYAENARFAGSRFGGPVSFKGMTFLGNVVMDGSSFQSEALFDRAEFQQMLSMQHCRLHGPASFKAAAFSGAAVLAGTKFEGDVSFTSSAFGGRADLSGALFSEDARFLGARFSDSLDMTAAAFKKNLILEKASIKELRMAESTFSSGSLISLKNAEFQRLEIQWSVLQGRLVADGSVYMALVRNFRNLEWFLDADGCYFQYRRDSQGEKPLLRGRRLNWSKLFDMMAWISCGYGVRPAYTIMLSLGLVSFFALLFWASGGIVVEPLDWAGPGTDPSQDPVLDQTWDSQHRLSFLDNLYYSALTFLSRPPGKWYSIGISRYAAVLEGTLGWLLMALFLVTLGRIMIR
ncbi:MAG TPA: pentapeptide repeat-containing protein [Methanotrichaceae archaeon]|nr:pentapeptide repeat-containing protein [Methanotrichaceae archaeon]HQF16077.1 pentapeptide repeat-containing protein [Methanotrichaceae archaeon]HQI90807.1 pentapeptide repeat-containing protein [Methanotrichaceae archaeon]HQJ28236.1 pentapeptide repeat-containing protein [Methanotrichaceae archaeon]